MPEQNHLPMQEFYGTKRIQASSMTRAEYNQFRGWELPKNENGEDAGYLVEYLDGGKPNVEGYTGYVSWSPAEQFEAAYQPTNAMSFGHALVALQAGQKVCRQGWNGKGMFLVFIPSTVDAKLKEGTPYQVALESNIVTINGHVDMYTADGKMQPGWLASQTDMTANDWQITDRVRQPVEGTAGVKVELGPKVAVNFSDLVREAAGRVHKDSGVGSDVTGAVVDAVMESLQNAAPPLEKEAA